MAPVWTQLKNTYTRLEISFWEFSIHVMHESAFFQRALCSAHRIACRNRWFLRIPPHFRWATTGLGCGFLIGLISAIV